MTDRAAQPASSDDPLVSILVPVYRPRPEHLTEAIASVLAQSTDNWELILAADGPQPDEIEAILARVVEPRIIVTRTAQQGGISAATNAALAHARGTFVAFLDNDDLLAPRATAALAEAIALSPRIDVVYSDEDKLDIDGRRVDPFHKPAWSPERLRGQMYLGHLVSYRRSLVEAVGGLRTEFNGAQDHDLALRVTERARHVAHIPEVLYHWRQSATSTALDPSAKRWAFEAGTRAIQDHLDRLAIPAIARPDERLPGVSAIDPRLRGHPPVSIIILTGGSQRVIRGQRQVMVENAIRSVIATSTYPDYEIVVVTDRTSSRALADQLTGLGRGRVRVVRDEEPFNFARANNLGVDHARGSHLIFLNDDTEVITPDWIERLVLWSSLPGVGVVGCCLEYPDGRIQHGGIVTRPDGPSHRWAGFAASCPGTFGCLALTVNMIGATGACLAVERSRFESVGGFCPEFPLNFNDVDLCFKFISQGFRNVVDNRTRLVHFETSSRPNRVEEHEVRLLWDRWGHLIDDDPWDNPHLRGYGVEDVPAPTALTRLREMAGYRGKPRVWPPLRS